MRQSLSAVVVGAATAVMLLTAIAAAQAPSFPQLPAPARQQPVCRSAIRHPQLRTYMIISSPICRSELRVDSCQTG